MRNRSRRLPRLGLILLTLSFLSRPAPASELEAQGTYQRKFQRGLLNMSLAPLEITHALAQEKKENKALIPWFNGLARGLWFGSLRAVAGVYEVLTAPLPIPSQYRPMMLPEFPSEHLGLVKDDS